MSRQGDGQLHAADWIRGGGAMGRMIRDKDWSQTSLGPLAGWPRSLRIAINICINSRFPMFVWWGEELFNLYNDAYAPMLGKRHPAALGRPAQEIWSEIWQVVGPQAELVFRGEATWNERVLLTMERQGYTEDAWFTWSYSPIYDESGSVAGLFCAVTEETLHVLAERERKRAQEERERLLAALEAEQAKLLSVIEQAPAFICTLRGPRHVFELANERYFEVVGRRDLIGRSVKEIFPEVESQGFLDLLDGVYRRGESFVGSEMPLRLHRKADGRLDLRYINFVYQPLREADGNVAGIFVHGVDVTDWVSAREALRESEQTQRALIEQSAAGIAQTDLGGTLLQVNQRFCQILGYPMEELLGQRVQDITHPDDRGESSRLIARGAETGAEYSLEKRYVCKDGSTLWASVSASVIKDPAGRPASMMGVVMDITPRKRAEEARRMSEFRSQRLVEQSPLSTQVFAPDGSVRQVNRAWERLWGVTLADYPDYNILNDQQLVDRGIMPLLRRAFGGEPVNIEPIPYRPDRGPFSGQVRWCGAYVYPVKDQNGRIEEVVLVHHDVTERREAEATVRESAERLRALFDQSTAGIAQLDLSGRFIFANQWFCDMLGYSREQLMAMKMQELTHPEDIQPNMSLIERATQDGRGYKMEKRYVRKDGSIVWISLSGNIIRDAHGNPQAVLGVVTDITERKRAEERLARDALLLANVRDSVIVTDLDGIITFWNEGATHLFGWSSEQMIGRPYAAHLPEPSRTEVMNWIGRIAAGEAEFDGEWLDMRQDSTPVWIQATTRRIADASGRPIGIMGVSRDISERKRAEAERERLLAAEQAARSEAERAGRMKDEFLATLSHELRTPLNAILGWSQILAAGTRDEEDLSEGLRTIERNARAQTQIIEDLLDMSRIISGKVRLDVQPLNLASVVQAAVDTVKPAADAKDVSIQPIFDSAPRPIRGDPNRLQQVFWNLLSNAVKFTPEGGRVQAVIEQTASKIEVSVVDSGEGISAQFLPYVFDRFRQFDASTTRRHGGLGLGLAIARQLVELHGGSIRVASEGQGQGATFTVSLPTVAMNPDSSAPLPELNAPRSGLLVETETCSDIAGVKVLVVDDEADARAMLKRLLEDCKAVVSSAASAAQAFELLQSQRPDVLISDIGMPEEDGYSLIRRIRQLGPQHGGNTPAVALTAYARAEDRVNAIRAGFQQHVAKPVEPAELITVVASLVQPGARAT